MSTMTKWRPRLIVLLLGLIPFILLEAALWITGYGGKSHVSLAPEISIFTSDGPNVRIKDDYYPRFRTRPFRARKPPGLHRIFVVGDSVTWGWEPRSPKVRVEPAHPALLQQRLKRAYPGRPMEVLNLGGVGLATFRLVHALRQALRYEPDVVVMLAGHSEFIEYRFFAQDRKLDSTRLSWARYWKTLLLVRNFLRHLEMKRLEREARVDDPGDEGAALNLPILERDRIRGADELQQMLKQSRRNLQQMARACQEAGVPLILGILPSNLRLPPNVHDAALQRTNEILNVILPESVEPARRLLDQARPQQALEKLQAGVRRINADPRYRADWRLSVLHFYMGKAYEQLGQYQQARQAYVQAVDLDGLPHRVLSGFSQLVREVAREPGVHLVDLDQAFQAAAKHGIPGYEFFFDDCHPLPIGHAIIARELARLIRKQGLLAPP